MIRIRSIPIVLALVTASCSASYPTAPSPTLVAVQVFYGQAMSYAAVGGSYSFKAYAIWSDGAYEDVTATATWLSSDWQVLRPLTTAGSFSAVAAGRADIGARYQSSLGMLPIPVVRTDRPSYPRLYLSGGVPRQVGFKGALSLLLQNSAYSTETVTALAAWTSANPSIVTVDGDGSVTAVGVGTTSISASYKGLTVECGLSIYPGR